MFKRCLHRTYVYFWVTVTVCFYSCFVNDLDGQTMVVQWTPFRYAAVTAPGLSTVLLFGFAYAGIVLLDNTCTSHTGNATVAHLNRVRLNTFCSLEPTGKCLSMSFKKLSAYPGYYILTIRWIKQGDPSCTIPLQNRPFVSKGLFQKRKGLFRSGIVQESKRIDS